MKKKTLVLGSSENTERYSNKAIRMLKRFNHPVLAHGLREGEVDGVKINTSFTDEMKDVDTITLYLSAKNQSPYYEEIIRLNPIRVLFNPGTENPTFETMLKEIGIETERACTLVLLSSDTY
jgi:predicted CoA-binding protein